MVSQDFRVLTGDDFPLAPLERAELARTEPTVGETRAAELAAAIASLPPELAAAITASVGQQPERAVQAIRELDDALRAVDLLARASVGGGSFESARGPRVVMPAGLGGLVASLETHASMPAAATTRAAAGAPALRWLEPRAYGALASTASSTPAAVQHVAWADRWLARFAGASPRALETLDLMSAGPSRLAELASAAPSAVFVAPAAERAATAGELASAQVVAAPVEALRLDDNAETPDDLLAQISAAASRQRRRPAVAAQPLPPSDEPQRPVAPRETLADVVARSAPMAPGAGFSAQLASSPFARSLGHVLPLASAPMFDVRALLGAGLAASYLAGFVGEASHELPRSEMPSLAPPAWAATYIVPDMRDSAVAERDSEPGVAEAEAKTPLVARRSPLLSLDPVAAAPFARTLVDALGAPMLDETAAMAPSAPVAGTASAPEYAVASAAPGMIGDRAHAWSVAQERSTADLTFDFVTPELVLAARVYGLGPAEAAQAMRLALVGPSQLAAMASAVDRTFVQVMQVEASRRQSALRDGESPLSAVTTAYPIASGAPAAAAPAAVSPTAMFGVERRAPRGAFLWPSAAVGALGLHAPAPDGELQMPVAALELIAAHGVAELGAVREMAMAGEAAAAAAATPATPATFAAPAGQPEADVVAAAAALVPAERRAKFEALYVALARSATDRTSSPAARAARAVALAGRGEDTISARERAAVAWDVLPAIYATPSFETEAQAEASLSTGARAVRAEQRRAELREAFALESRPGLGGLTSRAGEALGVFVSPTGAPIAPTLSSSSSTSSASREVGTLLRAPTAAPELVQTGSARPTARHGGGEVEIPAWFESAARRMFTERSSAESATLAELTLVMSAPATQVAASSRAAPSAVPPAASPGTNASTQGGQQIDIEKTANEVYQQVLVLIEAARARNGEPYL